MTASSPKRPMTDEELERAFQNVPEEMVAEIIDGELHVSPRPAPRHARFTTRLTQRLGGFDGDEDGGGDGPGGWVILFEPELHLGRRPDKLVPDLAGWRRARMPEVPDEAAIALAPDWVCEVLSDRTMRIDRGKKSRIYAREGVAHLWFADPLEQTLEVWRLEGGHWREVEVFTGDARVRAEPFDALELDLCALWAR